MDHIKRASPTQGWRVRPTSKIPDMTAMKILPTILILALIGCSTSVQSQFIWDPGITTNCGLPCDTDQDCEDYDTDIKDCLTCMPTKVCGNPSCFDNCATNNSCPPECSVCSFQQCLNPQSLLECIVEPADGE
jgi:hypothetical protein